MDEVGFPDLSHPEETSLSLNEFPKARCLYHTLILALSVEAKVGTWPWDSPALQPR